VRLPDWRVRKIAEDLHDELSEVARRDGQLSPESIRRVVVGARRRGVDVPNVVSERSMQMVDEALCSM